MKKYLQQYRFQIVVSILFILIFGMSFLVYLQVRPQDPEQPQLITPTSGTNICSENWTCDSWDRCAEDGTQTRTCSDLNQCGTTDIQPRTIQSCEPFVFVEPTLGPFDIEIRDGAQCQADISEALALLEEKAPEYYADVRKYVGVIECVEGDLSFSDPQKTPPTIAISLQRPQWSLEIIASTIVHEALHSKLYNDYLIETRPYLYRVPNCVSGGLENELQIVREEIKVLELLGASEFDIRGTQTLIDSPPKIWTDVKCEE